MTICLIVIYIISIIFWWFILDFTPRHRWFSFVPVFNTIGMIFFIGWLVYDWICPEEQE